MSTDTPNPAYPVPGPPASYPYGPAPVQKKSNTWKWVLGILGGLTVLLCLGIGGCVALLGGAVNEVNQEQNAKRSDVTVTSCTPKPNKFLNSVDVGYKITNSGQVRRTYLVTFAVNDAAGNRLGEGLGSSLDLDPGQSTEATAAVLLDKEPSGGGTCVVTDVR